MRVCIPKCGHCSGRDFGVWIPDLKELPLVRFFARPYVDCFREMNVWAARSEGIHRIFILSVRSILINCHHAHWVFTRSASSVANLKYTYLLSLKTAMIFLRPRITSALVCHERCKSNFPLIHALCCPFLCCTQWQGNSFTSVLNIIVRTYSPTLDEAPRVRSTRVELGEEIFWEGQIFECIKDAAGACAKIKLHISGHNSSQVFGMYVVFWKLDFLVVRGEEEWKIFSVDASTNIWRAEMLKNNVHVMGAIPEMSMNAILMRFHRKWWDHERPGLNSSARSNSSVTHVC